MQIEIVLEPSDEGGYTVHVPALSGRISEGDTLEEARANNCEAIALYLEPHSPSELPEGAFVEQSGRALPVAGSAASMGGQAKGDSRPGTEGCGCLRKRRLVARRHAGGDRCAHRR